jgi:uncharacterized protein (DUF2249 family)
MSQKIIDVRGYPPYERHKIILEEFEKLKPGESFMMINDHEPVHLFHVMTHREDFDIDSYYSKENEEGKWVALLKKKESKTSEVIFTNIEKIRDFQKMHLPLFKFTEQIIILWFLHSLNKVSSYLFILLT